MGKKNTAVINVDDFIGDDGLWVRSWSKSGTHGVVQHHTKASILWGNIQARCNPNSRHRKENRSYGGCINGFAGFHEFAGWCQSQHGYLDRDRLGKKWHLDKDLLSLGHGKKYSEDTCVFITARLNSMLASIFSSTPGELPKGVFVAGNKFGAHITDGGKTRYLGSFSTKEEAAGKHAEARVELINKEILLMGHRDSRVSDAISKVVALIKKGGK